jgi:hypothetical protein
VYCYLSIIPVSCCNDKRNQLIHHLLTQLASNDWGLPSRELFDHLIPPFGKIPISMFSTIKNVHSFLCLVHHCGHSARTYYPEYDSSSTLGIYTGLLDTVEHKKPRISPFLTDAHRDNGVLLKQQQNIRLFNFISYTFFQVVSWSVTNVKVKFH